MISGKGGTREIIDKETKSFKFLIPESEPICEPVDNITISSIGYVDGKLHVQTLYNNTGINGNYGFLSIVDKDGNKIEGEDWYFSDENNDLNTYIDSVFDVPADNLSDYKLVGEYTTCDTRIDGDWEVTFKVN